MVYSLQQKGSKVSPIDYPSGATTKAKAHGQEQSQQPDCGRNSPASYPPTTLPPLYSPSTKASYSAAQSASLQLYSNHVASMAVGPSPINYQTSSKPSKTQSKPSSATFATATTNAMETTSKHEPANSIGLRPGSVAPTATSYSSQNTETRRNQSNLFEVGVPMYMPHGQELPPVGPSFGHAFYGHGGNAGQAVQFAPGYPHGQFLVNFRPDAGLVMATSLHSQPPGDGISGVGGREMEHSRDEVKPLRGRKRNLSQCTGEVGGGE